MESQPEVTWITHAVAGVGIPWKSNWEANMILEELKPDWGRLSMRKKKYALSAAAVGAVAFGSFAVGALAVGAVAIGTLAIGRLAINKGRMKSLEIEELRVGRLAVKALQVEESLQLPPNQVPRISA